MSKAFDKINIKCLQEACQRIGIPNTCINLITELHTSHLARIISAYGLTSLVHIKSDIKQGETYGKFTMTQFLLSFHKNIKITSLKSLLPHHLIQFQTQIQLSQLFHH